MSIINLFKVSVSFSRKEIISSGWLRTIFTENDSLDEAKENEGTEAEIEFVKPSLSECLRYMKSKAYKTTYGDEPVWRTYVRNYKGPFPTETRRTCVTAKGKHLSGSPCPICRDIYLMPHYLNVDLIKQFVSPFGGEIFDTKLTGVCQKQQLNLTVAIKKARNYGLLSFHVPHRHYNYKFYKK